MNENAKKKFGQKIRLLREDKDYSREFFAERADLSAYYIGQIERGQNNVTFNAIIKLANALEVEIKELFDFRL